MTPIHAELLARKLEAARNGDAPEFAKQLSERPRLLELLWFTQAMSIRPGGLSAFVERLLEAFPDRFQTKAMQEAGPPRNGRYTLAQCWKAWEDFEPDDTSWRLHNYALDQDKNAQKPAADKLPFEKWLPFYFEDGLLPKAVEHDPEVRKGVERFNWPFLKQMCERAAQQGLEEYLRSLCVDNLTCFGKFSGTLSQFTNRLQYAKRHTGFVGPWYCPGLLQTLFDFMDRHATEAAREMAETEVTRTVFRELEFARSQNVPVPIVGASRFGKTKAVSVWTEMRPGRARLVTVPDSNGERAFFAAHADAFGISYGVKRPVSFLKQKVEFVHRHSGCFLVYDEAHYLVPVSYHKATPPRRLNWVRCQVIDRGLGCAFFATPQSYRETLAAYVKKTGYCMEQWLGRMAPPVVLPESLDSADVLAVARNHFPDVPEPYLKLIAARAMQSEGYLKNVEICVKRARFLAGEHGRRAPALADVQEAIGYTMPAALPPVSTVASPSRRASARAMPPGRSASAMMLPAIPDAEFPRRKSFVTAGDLEPALAG